MKNIKYILWFVLLSMLSPIYIYAQNDIYSWCTGQYFKLTAYYSPMSWQDYYVHDSYQEDVILNGRWIHGASGKPVFDGMIAAPRKYSFGTKIIFPWFGIGEVSDRWGAIVAGSGSDRIDIRAGKWVLGIRRAYGMWPVGITGYICSGGDNIWTLWFVWSDYDDSYDDVVFWTLNQSMGRKDFMVAKLQYILAKYGYLTWWFENANYDEATRIWVCNYQINKNIYTGYNDDCGNWWPKTRVLFKTDLFGTNIKMDVNNIYKQNNLTSNEIIKPKIITKATIKTVDLSNTSKSENTTNINKKTANDPKKVVMSKVAKNSEIIKKLPEKYKMYFDLPIDVGNKDFKVKALQNILSSEWIEVKKTGIMDEQTKSAVYGLQLKYKLLTPSDKKELKWYMWPWTRILLNKLYSTLK